MVVWKIFLLGCLWAFPGDSAGKESGYNTGDTVSILIQEDPLEKEMATHSSILVWEIL